MSKSGQDLKAMESGSPKDNLAKNEEKQELGCKLWSKAKQVIKDMAGQHCRPQGIGEVRTRQLFKTYCIPQLRTNTTQLKTRLKCFCRINADPEPYIYDGSVILCVKITPESHTA